MTKQLTYEALEQRVYELERLERKRRKTEDELKASEGKLQEAHKLAGLGYWTWEIPTGKVHWSDHVYTIFGLHKNSFKTTIDSILALSPWPEEQQQGRELIQKVMDSHEKGEYDQKFLYPDGSIGYYHSTFQGSYNGKGELVSIAGTVMDITQRKQAEEELRQSEERYRSLVEHTMDGFFIFEIPTGRLIFLNHRFCDIFQYSMQEALSQTIWTVFDSDQHDSIRKQIEDCCNEPGLKDNLNTCGITCKDGNKIRAEMSISKVQYHGKPVMQGTLRDVTEKERLQHQFDQAQKMESIGLLA